MTAQHEGQSPKPARSTTRRTLVTTELLDQATQLFAAKGYESTSLQDIADAMCISRPALYHYVRSKDDLLAMLVEQVSQNLADVLADLAARADLSPTQKLRELTGLLVRQRVQHPAQFRILDQSEKLLPEPADTKHVEAKRRVLREMTAIIDAGVATGEFIPVPARTAALSLLGMCNWVAWWIKPGAEVEPIVATLTGFAQRMLASTADGRPATPADALREIRTNLDWLEQRM
ncbi:TetR/AcrR family transcriptional regulator [Dactylosporangium sp. NPDC051485]|uniref:TetR/AcrR family transcriptional regulator n=1 Tax=Dactylosporangium sp. NPDC051485 TaxID=3154846 RepID=UPI003445CE2F